MRIPADDSSEHPMALAAQQGLANLAIEQGSVWTRRAPYAPTGDAGECWTNAWRLAKSAASPTPKG